MLTILKHIAAIMFFLVGVAWLTVAFIVGIAITVLTMVPALLADLYRDNMMNKQNSVYFISKAFSAPIAAANSSVYIMNIGRKILGHQKKDTL